MKVFTFEVGQSYTLADIPDSHRDLLMSCHHSGACDSDVQSAATLFAVDDPDGLRRYLREFGAWDADELADDPANLQRLIWLGAGDIQERGEMYIGI